MSVVLGGAARRVDDFELAYVTADGVEIRRELAELWAAPLEGGLPVRRFRPYKDWLHLRDTPQPACPRCTARHRGRHVMRLFAHHEYACRRHGYWLGPPDVGQDHNLRRLADIPELLTAQRKHQRLHHTNAPVIETYYPQPGPYARQRARLADQATEPTPGESVGRAADIRPKAAPDEAEAPH